MKNAGSVARQEGSYSSGGHALLCRLAMENLGTGTQARQGSPGVACESGGVKVGIDGGVCAKLSH